MVICRFNFLMFKRSYISFIYQNLEERASLQKRKWRFREGSDRANTTKEWGWDGSGPACFQS